MQAHFSRAIGSAVCRSVAVSTLFVSSVVAASTVHMWSDGKPPSAVVYYVAISALIAAGAWACDPDRRLVRKVRELDDRRKRGLEPLL